MTRPRRSSRISLNRRDSAYTLSLSQDLLFGCDPLVVQTNANDSNSYPVARQNVAYWDEAESLFVPFKPFRARRRSSYAFLVDESRSTPKSNEQSKSYKYLEALFFQVSNPGSEPIQENIKTAKATSEGSTVTSLDLFDPNDSNVQNITQQIIEGRVSTSNRHRKLLDPDLLITHQKLRTKRVAGLQSAV